ncbi:peptide deformylase [Cellulomonas xiejunii]|uniref:Peptide deformylase n=1 Tax=Cellulomonas xiejunii TaxID=2968083 RepID=A0ABY5KNT9_9CELL|nr:peptide deformylase [Cellulomonas xiejunii]MCC2312676.1 peptide deformylase [Cellulomonas xiejunii]MCC2320454.1 peptide deformylase [Cellulomonas xiejunii]UUI70750.1 peptide deformylase [Cellulomonas xiejunii]
MSGHDRVVRELVQRTLEAARAAGPDSVAPIVQAGHPVLRSVAWPYDGQLRAGELDELLALMHRTMRAAPGVGLAAPQIGLPLAIAVVEDPGAGDDEAARVRERPALARRVLVNPAYAPVGDDEVGFYEGCLSVVGYQAVVVRARAVRLTGLDEAGTAIDEVLTGWPARIVQHETDHLRGTLYVDRALTRSLSATDAWGAHWGSEPVPHEAARALGFDLPRTAPGGAGEETP